MQLAKAWVVAMSATAAAALAALTWPGLVIVAAGFIDNSWTIVSNRARKAGKLLAHVLFERTHGNRPVTLLGWSHGGSVVYHCLKELYRLMTKSKDFSKERSDSLPVFQSTDLRCIVENAFIIGGACSSKAKHWRLCRKVVAGRLVNGYCKTDW